MQSQLIKQIDAILPQTQCTRCGYPSCLDYATALAEGKAEINQCPPGGNQGIAQLAQLLGKEKLPLNPAHGEIKPRQIAVIDEDACIGCTLCIKACPVDAILGSNKMMHTVIANECSGCDLCVPVCPVDCISMVDDPNPTWDQERADLAKMRFENHQLRKKRDIEAREARLNQQAQLLKKVQASESKIDILATILTKAKLTQGS
jgi:electron transport complex protein RnfB